MWRATLAIVFGLTLAGALVAHTVFAQHQPPPGPGQPHDQGSMPSHGPDMHAEHMRMMQGMTGRRAPLAQIMRLATRALLTPSASKVSPLSYLSR
jgi:hypothetical protein